MEGPISKFMHVQQQDNYWHQSPTTSAFKSPDLIELNSDSERNQKPVEPLNYSSSQEEVETEDDCCDNGDVSHLKDSKGGVYDVNNDEESCHLLQTEDDSENSDSECAENSCNSSLSRSSSSAAPTVSDADAVEHRARQPSVDNYWDMTGEQEKYYTEQFLILQPDISGLVNGSAAKVFFEKSRLPHSELREIWQLADITRDGCLDLNEFKMAMHLVVLRRHGLPIPSHFFNRPHEVLAGKTSATSFSINNNKLRSSETPPRAAAPIPKPIPSPEKKLSKNGNVHTVSNQLKSFKPEAEWTTFDNEPVNFSSTCDTSGLVAPVPVRLSTPEDKLYANPSGSNSVANKTQNLQLKAIQRPKLSGQHPKVTSGTIAPPPPPRRKTHVRSSSLDLNKLTTSSEAHYAYPPRSKGIIASGAEMPARSFLSPSHQGGAFSVYRKPQPPSTATIHEPTNAAASATVQGSSAPLQDEIGLLRTENNVLSATSSYLLDQLSGLQAKNRVINLKLCQLNGSSDLVSS